MPDSVPENDVAPTAAAVPTAAETFHVSREETAPFREIGLRCAA